MFAMLVKMIPKDMRIKFDTANNQLLVWRIGDKEAKAYSFEKLEKMFNEKQFGKF